MLASRWEIWLFFFSEMKFKEFDFELKLQGKCEMIALVFRF